MGVHLGAPGVQTEESGGETKTGENEMRCHWLCGLTVLTLLSVLAVAEANETAPQFTAHTLAGETFTNNSLKGHVVLLQFWTTWCPVCRGQEQAIEDIMRDFSGDGLVVIAVDVREDGQTVKDYLAAHARSCHIVLTGSTDLVGAFAPTGFPYYVILDRDGNVAEVAPGGGEPWLRWVLKRAGLGQSPADAMRNGGQRSSTPQTAHVVTPKLIEIPDGPSVSPTKLRPPTVFVLKSGERLEVRRYTIMGGSLRIIADGKQRTVALTELDLKATFAADLERGVNLKIPTNPNEIVMGR